MRFSYGLLTALAGVCAYGATAPDGGWQLVGETPLEDLPAVQQAALPFGGLDLLTVALTFRPPEKVSIDGPDGAWIHLSYRPSVSAFGGLVALAPRNGDLYWRLLSGSPSGPERPNDHIHWEMDGRMLTRYRDIGPAGIGPGHGVLFTEDGVKPFRFVDLCFDPLPAPATTVLRANLTPPPDPVLPVGAGLLLLSVLMKPRRHSRPRRQRRHTPRTRVEFVPEWMVAYETPDFIAKSSVRSVRCLLPFRPADQEGSTQIAGRKDEMVSRS